MRPGPGLVVMALAFISGARRASTSSSSSSSSSLITTTTTTTIRTLTTTTPPAITPATTTTPAASRSAAATLPSSYDSRESLNFINAGGGFSFFQLPKVLDGSPGDVPGRRPSSSERSPAHNLPLNFDFYRRPALHAPDESFSSSLSSTRRVRSLDEGTRSASSHDAAQSTESAAGAPESSEATLINEEAETEPEQEPVEEQAEQEEEEVNSGLPVQYASSRAFDADAEADVVADEDIFALVAEDDLLSEESFDRLIKLNEEVDEDYNLDASLALTQTQQQQPQQQAQHPKDQQQEEEPESQQQDEIRLVDESVLHAQLNEKDTEVEDTNNNNNNKRETGEEGKSSGHDAYASHLIAIAQRDGGTSAATVATATPIKTSTTTTTTGATPVVDLKKSILGTATALTRLNPWISACDLAQPGTTGTDLQGQCSAGTLPMAWVDEGPGPPICPRSCAEQQPTTDSARNADNKLKYFINANRFNYKTRLSHNSNNNNMNIMKAMSRMRRDAATTEEEEATTTTTATTTEQELEMETMEASTLATAKAKDDVELDEQSLPTLPLHYSHLQTQEQLNIDEEQQQQQQQQKEEQLQQQQQQQQQCLDYLGDAAETSPQHLCGMRSPGQLLSRLRTLRLRHCCERSVFSALHTLALNATLTDRDECVRLLSDLLDVDALANRITCELAEILFRFDCRQVYSLVHQCDDCKEAYRRWVCSALVPYFAEPQDVDATSPPPSSTSPPSSTKATPKPKHVDDLAMTRGSTSKPTATATAASKSKRAARNAAGSDGISINIKHKSQKLISNNNKSNNGNNMNERQINQQHDEDNEPQNKNTNVNVVNVAQAFYNVVGIGQHQSQSQFQSQFHSQSLSQSQFKNNNRKDTRRGAISGPEEQFNNFISTANNADPSAADPVISKLQKRSTCKAEFRKRRRIRPCLSVCQTVEQKCPYLLPADRAPALPTQYAGEPTFSCLDQNIPETGEQLKKSSYGPNDCCYSYCNGPTEGLCTICKDFASTSGRNGTSSSSSTSNSGGQHRVHNITLTMSSPPGEHARAASVSVALRNVTTAPSGGEELLLERLPYYARHDSVYYYDDEDEGSDMPDMALSGGCAAVPSVSTRCTIPYYASGVAPTPPTQLLVWLSALLGLLSSCGAARQRCASRAATANSRPPSGRGPNCAASCHELLASSGQERQRETLHRRDAVGNGSASFTASYQTWACNWAWKWAWKWAWQSMGTTWPVNNTYKVTCRKKVRYFRGSSRSKLKVKVDGIDAMMSSTRDIPDTSRIINYRDLRQLIRVRIKCSDLARNRNDRNYRYFYYYNYNINDWWRRWKWFMMQQGTIAIGAL